MFTPLNLFRISVHLLRLLLFILTFLSQAAEVHLNVTIEKLGPQRLLELKGGGRLVVGQNLGSIDGDFNVLEALDGDIADYRIYNGALSSEQLKDWSKCSDASLTLPPLISLDNGKFTVVGDAKMGNITNSALCGGNFDDFYLFFTEKMDFPVAAAWCEKIEGKLALPKSEAENKVMWNAALKKKDQCSDSWTYLSWLGIIGDPETSQWLGLYNQTLSYTNFLPIYDSASKQYQCVATVSHNKYKWAASPCVMETCTMCSFTKFPTLRLRGLCKFSLLDRIYTVRDNEKHTLRFDGISHMEIIRTNGTWVMKSRRHPELWARMTELINGEFPVGVHEWEVFGDKCKKKKVLRC